MDDFGIKVHSSDRLKRRRKPDKQILKLNGEEITEWDLKFLYTRGERLSAEQIAFIFDCDVETVLCYLGYFGIRLEWRDRELLDSIRSRKYEEKKRNKEEELDREIKRRIKELKRPEVVAIIDGKPYVDGLEKAEYEQQKNNVRYEIAIEKQFELEDKYLRKYHGGISELTSIELRAIRAYRGLDRMAFATKARVPLSFVRYYELTKHVVVTKNVEDIYIKTLKITPKELKKIKDILAGKRTLEQEEDRAIPSFVRKEVWIRDKGKCTECGREKHLHYHHIQKFSEGGLHQTENLKLLCVACHAKAHREDQSYFMLKKLAYDLLGVTLEDDDEKRNRANP